MLGCGAPAVLMQILGILRPSASNLSFLQKTRAHRLLDVIVLLAAERAEISGDDGILFLSWC